MKRILAILMAVCLLCSACLLTACGGNGDVDNGGSSAVGSTNGGNADSGNKEESVDLYTLVNNAIQKTDELTSCQVDIKLSMDGTIMGLVDDTNSTMVLKMNGDKMSVIGSVSANTYGQEIETDMEYFFDGNYIYMLVYGEGYKMPCTAEEFNQQSGTGSLLQELPKELFDGIEGDGSNVVLTLDEAACESIFSDAIVELCQDIIGEDLNQVTTKDGKVTLSVKDGYLSTFNVEFTCEMGSGNDTATYVYKQDCTFSNHGANIAITGPAGYEDFMLLDAG